MPGVRLDASSDTSSLLLAGALLALIFAVCAIVIKRAFVDKKYFGGGQFVGRQIYHSLQNADRKKAVEEVIYQEEDEDQQEFTADDEHLGDENPR